MVGSSLLSLALQPSFARLAFQGGAASALPFDEVGPRLVGALGLAAARTVPIAWLVPAFGGARVAPSLRILLGVLLAVLCLPAVSAASGLTPPGSAGGGLGPVGWVLVLARELLVGATVGFCVAAMFQAAEAAGRLADVARGANVAEVLSPLSDERTSPTGDLYLLVALVIFFELGGLRALAAGLGRSYEAVPVISIGTGGAGGAVRPVAELILACVGKLLESAVGLAAPVLVALWMTDAVLGVLGRAVPQLPIVFAALPAKALLGLGVVLLGMGTVDAALVAGYSGWQSLWERAFFLWRAR
jgi:flagellar biosynthesis protein FliR